MPRPRSPPGLRVGNRERLFGGECLQLIPSFMHLPLNNGQTIVRQLPQLPQKVHSAAAGGVAGLDDPLRAFVTGVGATYIPKQRIWRRTVMSTTNPLEFWFHGIHA